MTRYQYGVMVIAMLDLKTARLARGLTQEQLAEKTGLNQTTISDIERGIIRKPSWDAVAKLSKALDYNPNEIFPVADGATA